VKLSTSRPISKPFLSLILLAILGLLVVVLVSACGSKQPTPNPSSPTLTLTATFPPTLTPTPLPLGSSDNPYIIGLVSETEDPQIAASSGELARQIGELSGASVTGQVFPSYNQLMDAMAAGQVHAAWLPPLTYLYASQKGLAKVALLTNHFGVYQYGAQFLANATDAFTPYYDPISGQSSADAATALAQFQDKRPCWVEPQSASGYILPAGLMRLNNFPVLPAVLAQTHTAVVRALYIKGVCDFGATFSVSGDPRTASVVQQDLPDVMSRIVIIWRTDASIPNVNLSLLGSLSEGDRQTLTNAFLDLANSPDGKALLSLSAGNYQIDEIKPVEDSIYDQLRAVAEALDLNLQEMLGK
jgi:phosphonate transport system substrate-binding protein